MQDNVNVAVIGCGYWGPNLIRNFQSLSKCRLKWMCDANPQCIARMEEQYPDVETTTDPDKVIDDATVDAVAIATPVRYHFPLAKKCLEAGKHTFVEKPMASSAAECLELIQLAEKRGVTLMVGHTYIYSASVRWIKEFVERGSLGRLICVSSQRLNLGLFQTDINVVWDLAPHDLAIILYVLNERPVAVNCQGKAHFETKQEEVSNLSIEFDGGGFAMIQSSWLHPKKVRNMTFVGSKQMLFYDDLEPVEKIKVYDKRIEPPPHHDATAEAHYLYHYGDIYSPHLREVEPLRMECQHFIQCIITGEPPMSGGRDGLKVVQILEAANRSLANGGAKVRIETVGE